MNATSPPPRTALRQMAQNQDFTLAEGELLHLAPEDRGVPWQLQVRSGAVWLTWPGCGDDVFLSAGQAGSLPAGAQALVQVEPRLARGAAVLRLLVASHSGREDRPRWWELVRRLRLQRLPG